MTKDPDHVEYRNSYCDFPVVGSPDSRSIASDPVPAI
jgi:hypothetical protein